MKKILLILTLLIGFFLVLSAFGVAAVTYNKTTIDNNPPDDPQIAGPLYGKPGKEYEFYFRTSDPEGDNVSYYIEWEDGTSTGWTPYIQSEAIVMYEHIWNKIDDYCVRCKAKDIHGNESNWSYQSVKIFKNAPFNYNFKLLNWFFERFPLFERLLNLIS